jgi:hypothetical protein
MLCSVVVDMVKTQCVKFRKAAPSAFHRTVGVMSYGVDLQPVSVSRLEIVVPVSVVDYPLSIPFSSFCLSFWRAIEALLILPGFFLADWFSHSKRVVWDK